MILQRPFVSMYFHYFEYLARMHPLLRHRNEIGSKTFDIVLQRDIKELAIARMDINAAADFILIAIVPTDETLPSEDGNTYRQHTGGFFILKKYSARMESRDKWWDAMHETEVIAHHILQRMVLDSQNAHPLFHRQADRYDNLNARFSERVVEEKWFGYLVTFSFKNILPDCPALACAWLDGGNQGKTPYIL